MVNEIQEHDQAEQAQYADTYAVRVGTFVWILKRTTSVKVKVKANRVNENESRGPGTRR